MSSPIPFLARRRLLCSLSAIGLGLLHDPAQAQAAWPARPVHLIVPAPAGSSLDVVARLLSERLKTAWGQPVLVENRTGAGGLLGTEAAAHAAPDGLTLVLSFNGPIAYGPFLYAKMPYDPAKDLAPVVMTTSQPNLLAVHAGLPPKTLAEFIAWAKAKAGGLTYASLGKGSSSHLTMAALLEQIGAAGTHVPFNGSPPAALALAQGEVDAAFMTEPALIAQVRAQRVRLLAASSAQRPDSLKGLPTLPGVESLAWNGLFAPAGTPEAVRARINADVNAALREPALRQALALQGLTPVGGSAAAFRQLIAEDAQRTGALIRRLGLKPD